MNRGNLGDNETNSHTASSTKNNCVHASIKSKVQNLKPKLSIRFILTCHHYGKLGHIRLKYRELLSRNKTMNVCVRGSKSSVQNMFPPLKVQNLKLRIAPKFILTCHNCDELGQI